MNKIFKNTYDNSLRFHTGLALLLCQRAKQALQLQHEVFGTCGAWGRSCRACSAYLSERVSKWDFLMGVRGLRILRSRFLRLLNVDAAGK